MKTNIYEFFNMLINYISSLSRDDVTFFIACFGCFLSIANIVYGVISSRSKIHLVHTGETFDPKFNGHPLYLELFIENCCKLPISISRISVEIKEQTFFVYWLPVHVYSTNQQRKQQIISQKDVYSVTLPCELGAFGVVGGVFVVYLTNDLTVETNDRIKITLFTNRGKKKFVSAIKGSASGLSADMR